MSPSLLRGAAAILDAIFILLIVAYLARETSRRRLTASDWLVRLPPPMHFAVAVVVCDAGVLVYLIGMTLRDPAVRIPGAALILVGSLCKIRSISRPDYGDLAWMLSAALVAAFVLGSSLLYG